MIKVWFDLILRNTNWYKLEYIENAKYFFVTKYIHYICNTILILSASNWYENLINKLLWLGFFTLASALQYIHNE